MAFDLVHETAQVNGTTLAYSMAGPAEGKPVVCSHSLFLDRRMWYPLMELLVERGYLVIAYDHRGQADSARAERREDLDVEILTADAAAFIEARGWRPCHVIGNSLGGFIWLRLAARRPELIRTCTVIGSSAEEEYRRADYEPLVAHLTEHGAAQVTDSILEIMFGRWTLQNNNSLISTWRERISELGPSIGDASYGVVTRKRVVEELHQCAVPVLAIAGAEDNAYPTPISSDNIADACPRGRTVTIPKAGHSAAIEQTELVLPHLVEQFALADGS
ncbi:alpha/beta hydrolase [Nocardia sp. NBC_01730]|uniref:alpha/beta fold hydrolase n=1 Tax=Nocardia sp. NBC_01730 TaxID=2975998 RepID=UPI002E0D4D80|nr:alpha/beta hydrolase [Nocardia sp. NBC_01730]